MDNENTFLHELSSPLTVALMRLSSAQESLNIRPPDVAAVRQCVDEGTEALTRACALIDGRRRAAGAAAAAARAARKILVVDDDADLRDAIAFDLARKGHKILHAGSGNQAFELVKTELPDMVISDIRMPDGDGVELLKRIKELNHEIPVLIFITGFADLSLPEAYQLGAEAVLSKPFQRSVLLQTVEQALLSRQARWRERPERVEGDALISLRLPAFADALQGHLVNIGRGGIFIALQENIPAPGTVVDFEINFEDEIGTLGGQGVVRWNRTLAGGPEQPPGCGIEFQSLRQNSLDRILAYIAEVKEKAFIPAA